MEKKYYVRYLPSPEDEEGNEDSLYFFKINDSWSIPAYFDDYLGSPIQEVKLAKLFICTKDLKVGDSVVSDQFDEWMIKDMSDPHNIYCIDGKGGSHITCVVPDCQYRDPKQDVFKVIGPVPKTANIEEGNKFDSDVVRILIKGFTES